MPNGTIAAGRLTYAKARFALSFSKLCFPETAVLTQSHRVLETSRRGLENYFTVIIQNSLENLNVKHGFRILCFEKVNVKHGRTAGRARQNDGQSLPLCCFVVFLLVRNADYSWKTAIFATGILIIALSNRGQQGKQVRKWMKRNRETPLLARNNLL